MEAPAGVQRIGRHFSLGVAIFLVFGLSTTMIEAWNNKEGCGRTPISPRLETEDRVVGGEEAVPGSWPWHAGLHSPNPFIGSEYFCGGALISECHVLTAAHCVRHKRANSVLLRVGSHSRRSRDPTEQYTRAQHICVHADRNMDIGIIKLATCVNFTDTVQPVCLPEPGSELSDGTTLYVTGWGRTKELSSTSHAERLQQVMTKSISNERCAKEFHDVPKYLLCGSYEKGTPCQGDSGGPLVRKKDDGAWVLEGLVSKGGQFCKSQRNKRAMRYMKVSHVVDWVDKYLHAEAEGSTDPFCARVPNVQRNGSTAAGIVKVAGTRY